MPIFRRGEERAEIKAQLDAEADFNQRVRALPTSDPNRWPELQASDRRMAKLIREGSVVGYGRNGVGYAVDPFGEVIKFKHCPPKSA